MSMTVSMPLRRMVDQRAHEVDQEDRETAVTNSRHVRVGITPRTSRMARLLSNTQKNMLSRPT